MNNIKDARLRVIRNSFRGGVSRARNLGIDNACGDYLVFVDSDDWIADTMLEKLISASKKYHSEITICGNYLVYSNKQRIACDLGKDIVFEKEKLRQYVQMFMLKRNKDFEPYFPVGQPWATLYTASLIKNNNLRFVDGMQYKEDVIFSLYAAQMATTIVRINDPLYYYNKCNEGSLTTNGLKIGMLPRIDKDICERVKYVQTYGNQDPILWKGLYQYSCRTFIRNVVPACITDSNYKKCKELFSMEHYSASFKNVDLAYLNKVEKAIIILLQHHALPLYYFALKIYLKIKKY